MALFLPLDLIPGVTKIGGNQWLDYGQEFSVFSTSVSRSATPRFPPFFDISRRGLLQFNLSQSPQSSSTLSSSRSISCAHTRWKSRPPERLRPLGSPARVRTAITFWGSVDGGTTTRFRSCSRRWRLSFLFLAARHRAGDRHCNISARHRAGRLHQQSTMSLSGASGSALGMLI